MRRILITCALVAGLPLAALANLPIFKIADFNTVAPDGGTFTGFGLPVADRDNPTATAFGVKDFVFPASSSAGVSGIYGYNQQYIPPSGTISSVYNIVNTTMPAPTGGNYTNFSGLSAGYGELGFIANTTTGTQLLMASDGNNPLFVVAQTGTSPSPGQTIGSFQSLSVMEGNASAANDHSVMEGEFSTDIGIYDYRYPSGNISSGPLTFSLVANTSTTPPGATEPFDNFGPVSFKAGRASTNGGNRDTVRTTLATIGGIEGIYYGSSGAGSIPATPAPLAKLVDIATPSIVRFTGFENPIVTSWHMDFIADYTTAAGSQQGIFTYGPFLDVGQTLSVRQVFATGDIAPDSGGAHFTGFTSLADASTANRTTGYEEAFVATLDNGEQGLYIERAPYTRIYGSYPAELFKIFDTSDLLDGKSLVGADIELSPEAAGDAGLTFKVNFEGGAEGLYYLEYPPLPEPTAIAFLALPLLMLLRRRRHGEDIPSANPGACIEQLENRTLLSSTVPIGINASSFSYNGTEYHMTAGDTSDATQTANTTAVDEAIDEAYAQGGGVVYLPGGNPDNPDVYSINGSVHLLSDVILRGQSADGTVINYTGSDAAIETTTTLNGSGYPVFYDYGVQNLTIQAGSASAIADDFAIGTTPHGPVRGDFDNLAIEAGKAGISLSSAQNCYFNNIQFTNFGSAAIDVPDGLASDFDNIVVKNTPSDNFVAPVDGMIDVAGQFNLIHNVWIDLDAPVLDFKLSGNESITVQDVWIAQASTPTVRYLFAGSNNEATIDTLALDVERLGGIRRGPGPFICSCG